MYGIIMATHGNFASGLYNGFKLICGEFANIKVVDFMEGDSTEILDGKLQKAYDELKDYDAILFLTDLAGGTPFNRAVLLFANKQNVRILSGLSFPLLYMATMADKNNLDEDVQFMLDAAKEATVVYADMEREVAPDSKDGI